MTYETAPTLLLQTLCVPAANIALDTLFLIIRLRVTCDKNALYYTQGGEHVALPVTSRSLLSV